jgi:hypothetical protein
MENRHIAHLEDVLFFSTDQWRLSPEDCPLLEQAQKQQLAEYLSQFHFDF